MRFLLYLGLACSLGTAHAQADLRALVDAAWTRHPQARQLESRAQALAARRSVADAWLAAPAAVSISSRNDRPYKNQGLRDHEVELALPLWLPGQRGARQAAAMADADALDAVRDALRLQLAGEVREAWIALALARSDGELARTRLGTAQALEQDLRRRLAVGESSRFDANLAATERLTADAALQEASIREQEAAAALALLTGTVPEGEPTAPEAAPAIAPGHPNLAAARLATSAALARVREARETTREAPELAVGVRRERADLADPYANSLALRLRLPLGSAPRHRAQVAEAQADLDLADAQLRLQAERVSQDQRRAALETETGQRLTQLAAQRQHLAAENLRLARKAYQLGELDLAALLRTQASAQEADRAAQRARLNLIAARGRLQQAQGILP